MRTGRKRKTNVLRDSSGKSRGEKEIVHPESIAVRERELLKMGLSLKGQDALNQLAGFTLGCLLLRGRANKSDPGGISQVQYDAGDAWQKLCHRHAAIMGYEVKPSPKSPSFMMVGGSGSIPEFDQEEVDRVKERWTKCYNALAAAAKEHGGWNLMNVVFGVCVQNWPASQIRHKDYGMLRIGLNALAKVM